MKSQADRDNQQHKKCDGNILPIPLPREIEDRGKHPDVWCENQDDDPQSHEKHGLLLARAGGDLLKHEAEEITPVDEEGRIT